LGGVGDEIDDHLMELLGVADDRRRRGDHFLEADAAWQGRVQEIRRFAQHGAKIHVARLRPDLVLAAEVQNLLHQIARSRGAADHGGKIAPIAALLR
jgi:hypothetical protein